MRGSFIDFQTYLMVTQSNGITMLDRFVHCGIRKKDVLDFLLNFQATAALENHPAGKRQLKEQKSCEELVGR